MASSTSAPSYLTIGGQQYTITSNLSVAVGTVTSGTRYQVYAVQSAGVVSLVISANENSSGPASFSSWKLVASFYGANGSVFGGFVSLRGSPQSEVIDGGVNSFSTNGGTVTKGTSNIADTITFRREGSYAWIESHYAQSNAGTSTGTNILLALPGSLAVDPNNYVYYTGVTDSPTNAASIIGVANGWYSTNINDQVVMFDATHFAFQQVLALATNGWWQTSQLGFSNAFGISMMLKVKISGWSETPIEDL